MGIFLKEAVWMHLWMFILDVAPDMAKEITSPDFLPFLMSLQNSILIIEGKHCPEILLDATNSRTFYLKQMLKILLEIELKGYCHHKLLQIC
jgi:hypothetical protein